jgi:ABC-type dipeptide/oligopeptide/nickel transport system ATPase component
VVVGASGSGKSVIHRLFTDAWNAAEVFIKRDYIT